LDGVSPIDLEALSLDTRQDAYDFLVHYGYDLSVPEELQESRDIGQEALAFLKEHLCPAPTPQDRAIEMPDSFEQGFELPDLLVMASCPQPLQKWACAMLRVMHTISHANHAMRSSFYDQIAEQILERYKAHLHRDEEGNCRLGHGYESVPLVEFSFREEKSRESLILKLLHKPDNVAQSVFDRIGIRLITANVLDAVLVLRYLRRNNLAIFANIMPGRSKNNLVDLQLFRGAYQEAGHLVDDEENTKHSQADQQILDLLRDQQFEPSMQLNPSGETNPHSSPAFRTIQFTCRQLIRVVNPLTAVRARLERKFPGSDLDGILAPLESFGQEQVLRFFFPYEVQLMDLDNFKRTQSGDGSHANYRIRQLRTARRRVLGPTLGESY